MKNKILKLVLVGALGTLATSIAYADTTTSIGTSEVDQSPSTFQKMKDAIDLEYFGVFSGPALNNWKGTVPTEYGEQSGTEPNLDSAIRLYYVVSPKFKIGIQQEFAVNLVKERQTTMGQSMIRAQFANVLQSGRFNLGGSVRVYVPVDQSETSPFVTRGRGFGFRINPVASYQLNNRMTFVTEAYIRSWEYRFNNHAGENGQGQQNIDYYLAPGLNYQLTSTLAATALYEMNAGHNLGQTLVEMNTPAGSTHLQLGVSWDITPSINLNPYVQLFPGGKVAPESAFIGATLFISVI